MLLAFPGSEFTSQLCESGRSLQFSLPWFPLLAWVSIYLPGFLWKLKECLGRGSVSSNVRIDSVSALPKDHTT